MNAGLFLLFDKKGDIIVRCYPCNGLGADVGGFAE